ncbi:MAG: HEPN domain-containing protein [Deltaproteobacteria bacterium]|nr:HEPN domain-containing protein [Deltaproteobacteria bacterium]
MEPDDEIREKRIAGYLTLAARDLKTAQLLVDDAELRAIAAYHLQQAAEKLVKAVFLARSVLITKEHRLQTNLDELKSTHPQDPWIALLLPFIAYDRFATTARYPSSKGAVVAGPARATLDEDSKALEALLGQARKELK